MEVIDRVKAVLAKRLDVSGLHETDLLTDIGLDSLDLVEVMLEIEDELNIKFTSDEIANLSTLKDVVDLINKKIG